MIFYEGPSRLTGAPVVAVATGAGVRAWGRSRNAKTGPIVQTWVLRADVSPLDAAWNGADAAICGDCAHRAGPHGRACYVNVAWGPHMIWKGLQRGTYVRGTALAPGQVVRLGAYGDPAAIPIDAWAALLEGARGWVGYTHAWRRPDAAGLRRWCMASVDTPDEGVEARALGWRTFRVRRQGEPLATDAREVVCPASHEAGQRTTCAACRVCDGDGRPWGPPRGDRRPRERRARLRPPRPDAPVLVSASDVQVARTVANRRADRELVCASAGGCGSWSSPAGSTGCAGSSA